MPANKPLEHTAKVFNTRQFIGHCVGLGLACCAAPTALAQPARPQVGAAGATSVARGLLPITIFMELTGPDPALALAAVGRIAAHWDARYAALLIEAAHHVQSRRVMAALVEQIGKQTGIPFTGDLDPWFQWLWASERPVHPDYAEFKARLYEQIDPRFREYFARQPKTLIRLDEIRWGGVRRDGIPPLKNPAMVTADNALWLHDDHIVFGVAINGDVRAYPKRILAWHEMFKDRIGGRELAGVYCTLCGALVLYDVTVAGVQHELGTSGFLYRSNKLMYDHATKSLWSTLTGTPVVGALVGKGIELPPLYVVTTTWKEWRTRHPGTQVLSLDTGYQRNYDEGVAYSDYFATQRLMFTVPKHDDRLPNKAEVLALRQVQAPRDVLAIAADFLAARPVYQTRLGSTELLVLTDASGANRVYEAGDHGFVSWDQRTALRDKRGQVWRVEEHQLAGPNGEVLRRQPAHRAFWFGWHAAFPQTRLVQ